MLLRQTAFLQQEEIAVENNHNIIARLLAARKARRIWMMTFLCLAVLVGVGTNAILTKTGEAKAYTKRVLDCQFADFPVAHRHDISCYDDNGVLVCPLMEIPEHIHVSDCYLQQPVLQCGLEETVGHTHDETCYELVPGDLICTDESEEHVHTDACWDWNYECVCGMEEGDGAHIHTDDCWGVEEILTCGQEELPVHIHDANCFITVEMTPEEIAALNGHGGEDPAGEPEASKAPEDSGKTEEPAEDENAEEPAEGEGTADTEKENLTEEEPLSELAMPEQTFTGQVGNLSVHITAPAGAFPADTEMVVSPVEDPDILNAATAEVEGEIVQVQAVDICFYAADGSEIEPLIPIQVEIVPLEVTDQEAQAEQTLVHVDDELTATVVEQEDKDAPEVRFESDSFSAYVVVYTKIEKTVLASNGHNYKVAVTYGAGSGIPMTGADLSVTEITAEDNTDSDTSSMYGKSYEEYVSYTERALGITEGSAEYIRLFDIRIVDINGEKIQPAEGSKVDVRIELADKNVSAEAAENTVVVHFADDSDEPDVMQDVTVDGTVISFATEGFSAYAIVEGPGSVNMNIETVDSLDELANQTDTAFYLSYGSSPKYFKNSLNGNSAFIETAEYNSDEAAEWFFEKVSDGDNTRYRIYTYANNTKQYMTNPSGNLAGLTAVQNNGAVFELSTTNNGKFYFKLDGDGKWLQHSNGGGGIRFWTDNKNAANSQITIAYASSFIMADDPYNLNGKSYGLMTWNGGKTAKALMASENSGSDEEGHSYQGCLEAKFLTVMSEKNDSTDKLYVPNNTADTVTDWTFEWSDNDIYYLKGKDGSGSYKYLSITAEGLSLADSPDDTCRIQVVPGPAGIHKGQIYLKSANAGGETLTYSGRYAQGFDIGGEAGSEWLYLVESKPEDVLTDYVKVNTATKVSISDTQSVYTGQKVIIYTREWKNDHYEYYAINGKGELVPCEESGDSIEWIGGNLNDMLWQFTEYTYEGTDTPSGYYELQNLYAKSNGDPSYLAPKYSSAGTIRGILSEETVGILMEGRQNKQYYSQIVAWDTPEYMYSSLMVDLNESDPTIKPCVSRDGLDFYFAIMDDLPVDDTVHTVPTVDNNQYGIVMRMIDLSNGSTNDASGQMNAFLGNTTTNGATTNHTPGLLSTNLVNGYPVAAGGSLADLFAAGEAADVNHLFIESTYRATGYYEYDSSQNFAYLTGNGDFLVYKELGTNDTNSKPTLKHGQFFPYNNIKPGRFASVNGENLYSATGGVLPESDPRKHEQLYLVEGTTDYYFAVDLQASFIQTPSGLDAWGHDIIFEFSGDDDFWLYVDDELVIDLGGIHSAVPGSVNFRTGAVNVNGTSTTLYDLFYNNYLSRGHTADEAQAYVDSKFEQNSNGQYVFKDNTPHTMHIFYMERGAGASNLHMKFNLAAVKKGTVQLNKKLDGVEASETSYAVFPYQVYYTMENDPDTEIMLRNAFNPNDATTEYLAAFGTVESTDYVFYKDRTQPVTFQPELKIGDATYYNVFMLKPEETAEINFPTIREDPLGEEYTVKEYRIVECGVDPAVYTQVSVNDEIISGTPYNNGNSSIEDYGIEMATTDARPKVNYVNRVETLHSLNFTKELYKKLYGDESPQKIVLYDAEGNYTAASGTQDYDLETAKHAAFNYRLYFKAPNDEDFSAANRFIYHIKDPAGYYCRWDSAQNTFVRITNDDPADPDHHYPNGTQDYSRLTDDYQDENGHTVHRDKFWSSFETGSHGTITGIPAYYTVEVRDLVPGTQYKIVERPSETDDGYKFWQYESRDNSQQPVIHTDTDPYDPMQGISGTIQPLSESDAWVRNYKGYGIRLKKIWADASTMKDRDPAYFAVYRVDSDGSPITLEPNSVRQINYNENPQELYWWYLTLPFEDTGLLDYSVFEVILTGNYTVSDNGAVTVDSGNVAPVENGGLNTVNGTLNGQDTPKPIRYKVTYEIEENENNADNVLVVKATNAPSDLPPVQFIKRDWAGSALPGGVFSLRYGENAESSAFDTETKTSAENGLIDCVYLQEDVTYTLTETMAPQGFTGLDRPLEIELEATASGWSLNVSPEFAADDPGDYEVAEVDGILSLIVKNRPYQFEVVKCDSKDNNVKIAGAVFSLFKQQTIGSGQTWDENNPVFTNLSTGPDGVIPEINRNLPAGTYQLREVTAAGGYALLTGHTDFTVSPMGVITLGNHPDSVTLSVVEGTGDQAGTLVYTLTIPNDPLPMKLKKEDSSGNALTGAKFSLMTKNEESIWINVEAYAEIDLTQAAEKELSALPAGLYRLTETHAPDGYVIMTKHVYFRIGSDRTVTLTDEAGTGSGDMNNITLSRDDSTGVYTITVKNTAGVALPMTGGPGTELSEVIGGLMMAAAFVLMVIKRRRQIA